MFDIAQWWELHKTPAEMIQFAIELGTFLTAIYIALADKLDRARREARERAGKMAGYAKFQKHKLEYIGPKKYRMTIIDVDAGPISKFVLAHTVAAAMEAAARTSPNDRMLRLPDASLHISMWKDLVGYAGRLFGDNRLLLLLNEPGDVVSRDMLRFVGLSGEDQAIFADPDNVIYPPKGKENQGERVFSVRMHLEALKKGRAVGDAHVDVGGTQIAALVKPAH